MTSDLLEENQELRKRNTELQEEIAELRNNGFTVSAMTEQQLKVALEKGEQLEKENSELKEKTKVIAEFGYNKANEWHFVKDGDLPKENEYIIIHSKLADNIAVGKRRCAGKIRKQCVYEWYFATYEGTYCLRDKDVIAWKEIVLPELNESE